MGLDNNAWLEACAESGLDRTGASRGQDTMNILDSNMLLVHDMLMVSLNHKGNADTADAELVSGGGCLLLE